jgi:hypothetical protein
VSRNARFRGVRGEKDFSFGDLFVGGFSIKNFEIVYGALSIDILREA